MSLFVGNVSKHVSLKEIENLFKKYGKCKIDLRDRYAFVQFDNDNHGQAAKKQLQGETFHGLELNIEWSKNSGRFGENNKRKNGGGANERRRSRSRDNRWRREDHGRGRSPQNDRKAPSYSGNTDIDSFQPKCPRDQVILQKLKAKAKEYQARHNTKKQAQAERSRLKHENVANEEGWVKEEEQAKQAKMEEEVAVVNGQPDNGIEEGMIQEDGEIPAAQ